MIKARTGLFRVIFTFLQVLILSFVIIQSHEISKVGAADTLHITGTVTDQGGNPVSNVSVYATDPGGSTPIDYGTITSNVSGYYDLQLSVAGTYDFHYDPPSGSGQFLFNFRADGDSMSSRLPNPFTLSLSKRCVRLRQAQSERL